MAQTRAEHWVGAALNKLGVHVVDGTVVELSKSGDDDDGDKIMVEQRLSESNETVQAPYDTVLWTAGSGPAKPIPDGIPDCLVSPTNRLAVDATLQCLHKQNDSDNTSSDNEFMLLDNVWALGDCAQVLDGATLQPVFPAPPKTAQCAIQQADVVADNVCRYLQQSYNSEQPPSRRTFTFREAGTVLTLGGINGAILAPQSGPLATLFEPLLDSTNRVLSQADSIVEGILENETVQQSLLGNIVPSLGLSLGSYGIGVKDESTKGTLAGTVSGLARRAIYAVAQPTNEQRAVSLASATLTTAFRLLEEAGEVVKEEREKQSIK